MIRDLLYSLVVISAIFFIGSVFFLASGYFKGDQSYLEYPLSGLPDENSASIVVTALDQYRYQGGTYPSQKQGLQALVKKPNALPRPRRWTQLLDSVPLDPWKKEYRYFYPGTKDPSKPEVKSAGPDKKFGTEDDISSQS